MARGGGYFRLERVRRGCSSSGRSSCSSGVICFGEAEHGRGVLAEQRHQAWNTAPAIARPTVRRALPARAASCLAVGGEVPTRCASELSLRRPPGSRRAAAFQEQATLAGNRRFRAATDLGARGGSAAIRKTAAWGDERDRAAYRRGARRPPAGLVESTAGAASDVTRRARRGGSTSGSTARCTIASIDPSAAVGAEELATSARGRGGRRGCGPRASPRCPDAWAEDDLGMSEGSWRASRRRSPGSDSAGHSEGLELNRCPATAGSSATRWRCSRRVEFRERGIRACPSEHMRAGSTGAPGAARASGVDAHEDGRSDRLLPRIVLKGWPALWPDHRLVDGVGADGRTTASAATRSARHLPQAGPRSLSSAGLETHDRAALAGARSPEVRKAARSSRRT